MPQNTKLDSIEFKEIYLPYDKISAPVGEVERLVDGLNVYTTLGGVLAKRPGTVEFAAATGINKVPFRLVKYETMESPPKVYILGSFYNGSTGQYEMWYNRPATNTGWLSMGTLRNVNTSTVPHEIAISRGLAYIRAVPASGGDKYGTIIFDGTDATTNFWGLAPPEDAAKLNGQSALLSGDLSATGTTLTLASYFSGITAGDFIQIEYEQVEYSSGAGPYTVVRGANGTTASAHPDNTLALYREDWAASAHLGQPVNVGWAYSYAYKSPTGQVSNRAPLETNPDEMPSITGPFRELIPKILVPGNADTTNLPEIIVYRSTDGSTGPFYELETITNTGAGNITYEDDSLESASGFEDPLPDSLLTNNTKSPTLVSNSPPPAVLAPLVTGVDTPIPGTPIASYQSREWYFLGNVLVYSADEEITQGIGEESFPSGIRGNFFRLQYPGTNIMATNRGMYLFTSGNTLFLTGTNRETFNIQPLYENIGMLDSQPRAIAKFGDKVVFLSQDLRIIMSDGSDDYEVISDPLNTDIKDAITASDNAECEIKYWGNLEKEWVIVAVHRRDDPSLSRQWVFDIKLSQKLKKYFWYPPWSIPSVAMYCERYLEGNEADRVLGFFIWSATNTYGRLVYVDTSGTIYRDTTAGTAGGAGVEGIDYFFDTFLHKVPPGNHVNQLRSPALSPVVSYLSIERTFNSGDEDPDIYYFLDDTWTTPIPATYVEPRPARRQASKGYRTLQPQINKVAYRFAFRIKKNSSVRPAEFQSYAIVYEPDGGA